MRNRIAVWCAAPLFWPNWSLGVLQAIELVYSSFTTKYIVFVVVLILSSVPASVAWVHAKIFWVVAQVNG